MGEAKAGLEAGPLAENQGFPGAMAPPGPWLVAQMPACPPRHPQGWFSPVRGDSLPPFP